MTLTIRADTRGLTQCLVMNPARNSHLSKPYIELSINDNGSGVLPS